ncbi:methyl-accepting chemotaxis protein [Thiorhodococcus fuscus]|uniref:Methyl-accepting chemotaxis protein n=1 Tax=Thiorhodococcus fuscus TaxID=527200 RepID=A0ABW4Y588_9GAMM
MKLRHKIFAAPGIILIFLVVFGLLVLDSMRSQNAALDEIYVVRFGDYEFATRLAGTIDDVQARAYRLINWMSAFDESTIDSETQGIVKSLTQVTDALAEASEAGQGDADLDQTYGEILPAVKTYSKQISDALDLATMDPNMGMAMMEKADKSYQQFAARLKNLIETDRKAAGESYDMARAQFGRALGIAGVVLGLALLTGILVSWILGRSIMKPLRYAADGSKKIAAGDLTVALRSSANDEVGDLIRALDAMRDNLKGMIESIHETAGQLGAATDQLVDGATKVAEASESQSETASYVATAVEELNSSINHMADNARQVQELSRNSSQVSHQGGEIIRQTLDETQRIASEITQAAQTIEGLGEQSAHISDVVGVIQGIAAQTNLLALNAAIEAARAGSHGRGFAVVAEEVRELARRTAGSTDEIREMVEKIQQGSNDSVADMRRAVAAADGGVNRAVEAGESSREITAGMEAMLREVEAITGALNEQGTASQEISSHIQRIADMAMENSTFASHSAGAAKQLQEIAAIMVRQVSRFQIVAVSAPSSEPTALNEGAEGFGTHRIDGETVGVLQT